MDRDGIIEALTPRMTRTHAEFIAANFEVASAITTPDGSGFDATVWGGRAGTEYAGQIFVSMRGTEFPSVDVWGADVDLALNVAARSQIIDMVNWWLMETTPSGVLAQQIEWDPTPSPLGTMAGLPIEIGVGFQFRRPQILAFGWQTFPIRSHAWLK